MGLLDTLFKILKGSKPVVYEPVKPIEQAALITVDQLVRMGASRVNATRYCQALNDGCHRFGINTSARLRAFLAQIFEESGDLSVTYENLNYTVKNLMTVWPRSFPTEASCAGFVMNPEALANKQYGDRMGNTQPGDGWKYRGRGLAQITFKANYEACGKALGIDLVNNPDLLEQDNNAALSAGWFWGEYAKCNEMADDDSYEALKNITKKINGGLTNLDKRAEKWNLANQVFAGYTGKVSTTSTTASGPSEHFSWSEFTRSSDAARLGIDNSIPESIKPRIVNLAQNAERIRVVLGGKPISVSSGYRCEALNRAVGGAANSSHKDGDAMDFACPSFGSPYQVCQAIVASGLPFDQLIMEYDNWTHVGYGPQMRQQAMTIYDKNVGYKPGILTREEYFK